MIKIESKALIKGDIFTVKGESPNKKGYWNLEKDTTVTRRKQKVVIQLSEDKVLQGIEEYNTEMLVREVSREESPQKDVLRLKFLPTH
jgi:hypothetical protein